MSKRELIDPELMEQQDRESFHEYFGDKDMKLDIDIQFRPGTEERIIIVAPHGGKIEPFTPAIAGRIAGSLDCHYYHFISNEKKADGLSANDYHQHHIPNTQIADVAKNLGRLVQRADIGIAVHGTDKYKTIQVSGTNKKLADKIIKRLTKEGCHADPAAGDLSGDSPDNFINKCKAGGVQLEVPLVGYREGLRSPMSAKLCAIIADILAHELNAPHS